ncbi:MAG: SDR family oxidoreductase [Oligoflexia bacterium]|nr:SDR family oxidoreductase [Oligoflexia bacterium]
MNFPKKINSSIGGPSSHPTKTPPPPPPQHQEQQPGIEGELSPKPISIRSNYKGSNKLKDKVAIITGGDSGIGRSVAYLFALEGANIVVSYLNEHSDAEETKKKIESFGSECLLVEGDVGDEDVCKRIVKEAINKFKKINILVNNAAEQHVVKDLSELTSIQLEKTFRTNIFSFFYLSKAALPHLSDNEGCIINTTSVTAYKGHKELLDYSATKGAIVTFTRSLALSLIEKGIRVNGVAPGPIWTPLIPSSFDESKVEKFGKKTPMSRMGWPSEVAPCYVFLASDDSSYMTGQILHPNGGEIVNG